MSSTFEGLQRRFEALDALVKRLEDALVVEASLTSRYRDRQQEHERWLEDHEAAMRELDKKLNRIADMMGFRPGNGDKG